MAFANPSDEIIRSILAPLRSIAVVGCSPDSSRESHQVAAQLIARGHTVVPVNPFATEVLGRRCYPSLTAVPIPIEMVDIFRRSEEVGPVVDAAIAIRARIVWMQLGVIDVAAAARATAAGLTVVMDRCPAIEYRRLF
jgi:predicted CoA-binding protein